MKKLGIIGGMGSRAGAIFLKKIIDYSPAEADQEFPEIIFHNNSAIPDRTRAIVYDEPSPLAYILKSIALFNQNKVEVIALGCITSYYYYNQFSKCTSARIINPLHLLPECLTRQYSFARRIGLLATTGTIQTKLFHKVIDGLGGQIITLETEEQENLFMRSVYMKNGFKSARIDEEARELMRRAVDKLIAGRVDLIIGGCTEVSIALEPDSIPVPYLDTLDLLARKTVEYCYND
jgi:aspartate racemase